jgi:hypothetical protein
MSEEKNLLIKKALVGLVFIGFLVSPILLKPGSSKAPNTGSANLFGFELKDVAEQSGITFKHQQPILDQQIEHILPTIASVGAAVSVCDYNNDGWHDLYFTNSRIDTKNALFRNNADGSFTDVADSLGIGDINKSGLGVSMGSIWGDFDNDGYQDLLVYKWGKPELFRNIEGTGFEQITDTSGLPSWMNANSAVWLDFDGDGLLDLFMGGYYSEAFDLWNLKTTRIMPESFEYANNGGRNYLLKNIGNNKFRDVTQAYGMDVTKWTLAAGSADINQDGFVDLIIANDYSNDEFYLNINGEKFIEVGRDVGIGFKPKSGMNISFGDAENTGNIGLYITNITEEGVLLQGNNYWQTDINKAGINYHDNAYVMNIQLGGWSYGAQFGDLNNDGFQDLYVANGFVSGIPGTSYWYEYSKVGGGNKAIISDAANWPAMEGKSQSGFQQNKIWVNGGYGQFNDASTGVCEPRTMDSRSVVMADLWNRGVMDIIVANQNGVPFVYKNELQESQHWIDFELEGVESNKDAVGARVQLFWNNQQQVQIITGGIGFSGQNQHRVHFGLGQATQVDKIEITWPSGQVQEIQQPEIDKLHIITEGKS